MLAFALLGSSLSLVHNTASFFNNVVQTGRKLPIEIDESTQDVKPGETSTVNVPRVCSVNSTALEIGLGSVRTTRPVKKTIAPAEAVHEDSVLLMKSQEYGSDINDC